MPVPDVRDEENRPATRVTVMLDDDVLTWFRDSGRGWQKRMSRALLWYISEVEKQSENKKPET